MGLGKGIGIANLIENLSIADDLGINACSNTEKLLAGRTPDRFKEIGTADYPARILKIDQKVDVILKLNVRVGSYAINFGSVARRNNDRFIKRFFQLADQFGHFMRMDIDVFAKLYMCRPVIYADRE